MIASAVICGGRITKGILLAMVAVATAIITVVTIVDVVQIVLPYPRAALLASVVVFSAVFAVEGACLGDRAGTFKAVGGIPYEEVIIITNI